MKPSQFGWLYSKKKSYVLYVTGEIKRNYFLTLLEMLCGIKHTL